MSIQLVLLSGFMVLMASLALIRPAYLFEYPVAGAFLMGLFLVPQAWRIERTGDMLDFQPTLTWTYMILCMAATAVGYYAGRARRAATHAKNAAARDAVSYDANKLFIGSLVLAGVGGIAIILINRELVNLAPGAAWTGALAFYAMLSNLMLYGASLAWLLYLHARRKEYLAVALFGFGAGLPAILFGARREVSFTMAVIILLGVFFVRKKMIGRVALIPLLFLGFLLINYAGNIRGYINHNNANIVSAIGSDAVAVGSDGQATEVSGSVSDIAISSWTNSYSFVAPYYNHFIDLYVPAFIVGREIKDGLRQRTATDSYRGSRYFANGATRTGFADSFQAFHYFGCLVFFGIAYFMGQLWSRATSGDIKAQIYYILMLSAGLKVFTESTATFIGTTPLIFVSVGMVFLYARRRPHLAGPQDPLTLSTRLLAYVRPNRAA